MQRTFVACRTPAADGYTDYNHDLIMKLVYDIEGNNLITPYNPFTKNSTLLTYVGIDPESTTQNATTNVIVLGRDNTVIEKEKVGDSKRQKQANPELSAVLKAKAEQQEKLWKNQAKKEELQKSRKQPIPRSVAAPSSSSSSTVAKKRGRE